MWGSDADTLLLSPKSFGSSFAHRVLPRALTKRRRLALLRVRALRLYLAGHGISPEIHAVCGRPARCVAQTVWCVVQCAGSMRCLICRHAFVLQRWRGRDCGGRLAHVPHAVRGEPRIHDDRRTGGALACVRGTRNAVRMTSVRRRAAAVRSFWVGGSR
jgi:hypothetical protein